MVSAGQLLGFTIASLVLIVIPGPGVLFVVGRALAHGRRTALATACGHAAGNYVVAACVAVGLGTILQRSATVFVVVKILGALYLVLLGIHAIRHRKSLTSAFAAGWPSRGRAGGRRAPDRRSPRSSAGTGGHGADRRRRHRGRSPAGGAQPVARQGHSPPSASRASPSAAHAAGRALDPVGRVRRGGSVDPDTA